MDIHGKNMAVLAFQTLGSKQVGGQKIAPTNIMLYVSMLRAVNLLFIFSQEIIDITICDRVRIKVPFDGNLKNEIIKFFYKLGFRASFAIISGRNLLFLPY